MGEFEFDIALTSLSVDSGFATFMTVIAEGFIGSSASYLLSASGAALNPTITVTYTGTAQISVATAIAAFSAIGNIVAPNSIIVGS